MRREWESYFFFNNIFFPPVSNLFWFLYSIQHYSEFWQIGTIVYTDCIYHNSILIDVSFLIRVTEIRLQTKFATMRESNTWLVLVAYLWSVIQFYKLFYTLHKHTRVLTGRNITCCADFTRWDLYVKTKLLYAKRYAKMT